MQNSLHYCSRCLVGKWYEFESQQKQNPNPGITQTSSYGFRKDKDVVVLTQFHSLSECGIKSQMLSSGSHHFLPSMSDASMPSPAR